VPAAARLTGAEQRGLVEVRESSRSVLAVHTDRGHDPEAASRMSMALMSCRLAIAIDAAGGVRLESAGHDPFGQAVGQVALAIAEAGVTGTWPRLKSCPGHLCGWAFYDRSPSGRSRWCSMQLCGARAKMRAYRDRTVS